MYRPEAPTPLGIIGAGAALIGLIAYSPAVDSLFWSPKAATIPVLAGAGLVALVRLLQSNLRGAAIAGLALVSVAAFSALLSEHRILALFGNYRVGTGLLFVAALVGGWAIGASLTAVDRRWLGRSLCWGIGLNLVVSAAELLADLSEYQLFLVADRTPGLLGNPVYLASVLAGAVLAVGRLTVKRHWRWAAAAAPLGVGVQMAGSRVALLVAVCGVMLTLFRSRSGAALLLAGCLLFGFGFGAVLLSSGGGTASTSRLEAGTTGPGFAPRIGTWLSAGQAIDDRPIFGSGPGTFASATSKYRTLRIAKTEGPEQLFLDAHNVLVEYPVTTGLAGLVALLAWLAAAGWRATGPLAAFAVGILLLHLVQPQFVGTTPLAFLCLGAATRVEPSRSWAAWPSLPRVAAVLATAAGVGAASVLLYGDALLRRAELTFELVDAHQADNLLPYWAAPASKLSKLYSFEAIVQRDPGLFDVARQWQLEATRREPTNPALWTQLAELELSLQRPIDARAHFYVALRHNPQSVQARLGLAQASLLLDDPAAAMKHLALARPAASSRQRELIDRLKARASCVRCGD